MKSIVTLILFLSLNRVFGQTDKEHPIDVELETCLSYSENQTTIGMTQCVVRAIEKWDKELNTKYQLLLNLLTDEQKVKLRNAQRQWLAFRDKEIEFSNQLYTDMQGTMWGIVAAQTKLELTRQRTLELTKYISNLN